jgi:hypothetical protein
VQGIGLKGVVFVDAGNAYSADEGITIDETRVAAGGGGRWLADRPAARRGRISLQHQAPRPEEPPAVLVRRAVQY